LSRVGKNIFNKSGFFFVVTGIIVSGFFASNTALAAISNVTVTSPNGGESIGGTRGITWTSVGGVVGDTVSILYSTDNFDESQVLLASGVAFNASPFSWNTATVTEGTTYKIKVFYSLSFSDKSNANFTVDNTAPIIASHADIHSGTTELGGATVTYTAPNAVDAVYGTRPAVCTRASGSLFSIGTTSVICTKVDVAGNIATTTTFNVVVTPVLVSKVLISASPTLLDVSSTSTITVTGQDQFGNTVTGNNSTVVVLSADNGGAFATTLLTLTSGVATTTLSKSSAGNVNVNVYALGNNITPSQVVVTFTSTPGVFDDTASLATTGINTVNSLMTADGTYLNGGSWAFLITVPTHETSLSLKFGDWISGGNSIAAANNMRIYSAQSSNATASTSAITITGSNTYSTNLTLNSDLDARVPGRQVRVVVDLRVPVSTGGGSYSTNYGVKSR